MAAENKKGIQLALGTIAALIIILVSAGALYGGIKYLSSKFDEVYQVESCRILNEFKFGIRAKSKDTLTSGESICATIDKHTDEKTFVPTPKFNQDKEGAEQEIRNMIINCWYMWLDGEQPNTFRGYPLTESCFTCYTFKLKDDAKGITYSSISKRLEEPYKAKDTTDACSTGGGGMWRRQQCLPDEKAARPKSANVDSNLKCCIKLGNECENKGGRCSREQPSGDYTLFTKWQCPSGNCYTKKDASYSYIDYIRRFNDRGGDVFFMPQDNSPTEVSFNPEEIYAISFISPSRQLCYKGQEEGAKCYAMIGTYALGIGTAGYALIGFGAIGSAAGTVVKYVGGKTISLLASNIATTTILSKLGVFGNLLQSGTDFVLSPATIEMPNYVMVSNLKGAQDLGCTIDYGV